MYESHHINNKNCFKQITQHYGNHIYISHIFALSTKTQFFLRHVVIVERLFVITKGLLK